MFEESGRKTDSKMGRTETVKAYQNQFCCETTEFQRLKEFK